MWQTMIEIAGTLNQSPLLMILMMRPKQPDKIGLFFQLSGDYL
jgi:hypothetical protein